MSGLFALPREARGVNVERRVAVGKLKVVGKSLLLGAIAGMATFTYTQHVFAMSYVNPWWPLSLIALAGVFNHFYVENLRDGLTASFLGIGLGFAIHLVAWLLPLFVAGYSQVAIHAIFFNQLGQGLLGALMVLPMTYYAAYFGALLVFGAFQR
jgi:hypothetical protein